MASRAAWASSPIVVAAVVRASSQSSGAGSAKSALLAFGAATEEATPKELADEGEHGAQHRTGHLQPHELVERKVHAAGAGERILQGFEQQADEFGPLQARADEPEDDSGAGRQQREAVIDLRNFFSHLRSIGALAISVYRIAEPAQSTARALAARRCRSHTPRR